jgi:hypothetical protein
VNVCNVPKADVNVANTGGKTVATHDRNFLTSELLALIRVYTKVLRPNLNESEIFIVLVLCSNSNIVFSLPAQLLVINLW